MGASNWWTRATPLEWALLPLRLFLGVTFVYAGIQKVTDPQFFNTRSPGYIGNQIIAFAHGSPIHSFLMSIVLPHSHFFGIAIILGEIAIGLGTLVGFLFRPAAFFGMLLSLMFFLSASWHVYPYFYGADIVFVFAWITMLLAGPLHSALPTLDGALVPRYLNTLDPESRVWPERFARVVLGVGSEPRTVQPGMALPAQGAMPGAAQAPVYNSKVGGYPQGVPYSVMNNQGERTQRNQQGMGQTMQQRQPSYKAQIAAQRRSMENRRSFLLGILAGGLGMLGITVAARVLSGDGTSTAVQTGSGNGGTTTQTTPGAGSNVIAQESAVPTNSAVTFTIPSNGDPGVLIHLKNGKFVCFDATCTHAGCLVQFDPGTSYLICPCHGAEFDPANSAAVVAGPAPTPLTSVPININNSSGSITLQ